MNTLQWVTDELHKRRGEWKQVAEDSGVPYFTIAKISQGVTKNPRWHTITSLITTLEAKGGGSAEVKASKSKVAA